MCFTTEPCLGGSLLKTVPISSISRAGITTVGDIIDLDERCYISAGVLSHKVGINSIASDAIKQVVSRFKESWTHCINSFFTEYNCLFFEHDPDVTLSQISSHVEVTSAFAERKAFYNFHSALQTADDNLPEDSAT